MTAVKLMFRTTGNAVSPEEDGDDNCKSFCQMVGRFSEDVSNC